MVATVALGDAIPWMELMPDASVDFIYIDPPFYTNKKRKNYDDRWKSPDAFASWLQEHLYEARRVLTPHGSILIHLDYRAVHYARVYADVVFGYKNMLNEVIWNYNSGGAGSKNLARKHDNMLWYVKDLDHYTFNEQYEPYATPNVEGRPGFNPLGRKLTDVWNMSIISTTGKERVGYEGQKPVRLMERILEIFTDPGDVVLDFFCGSGTTGVACQNLGRIPWLIDKNPEAVSKTVGRLVGTVSVL